MIDRWLPLLPGQPDHLSWLSTCVAWAEVAARLSDIAAAGALVARLAPHRALVAYSGTTHEGTVAESLGGCAPSSAITPMPKSTSTPPTGSTTSSTPRSSRPGDGRSEPRRSSGEPIPVTTMPPTRLLHEAAAVAARHDLGGVTREVERVTSALPA